MINSTMNPDFQLLFHLEREQERIELALNLSTRPENISLKILEPAQYPEDVKIKFGLLSTLISFIASALLTFIFVFIKNAKIKSVNYINNH